MFGFGVSSLIIIFCSTEFAQLLNFLCNLQTNLIVELCNSVGYRIFTSEASSKEPYTHCFQLCEHVHKMISIGEKVTHAGRRKVLIKMF